MYRIEHYCYADFTPFRFARSLDPDRPSMILIPVDTAEGVGMGEQIVPLSPKVEKGIQDDDNLAHLLESLRPTVDRVQREAKAALLAAAKKAAVLVTLPEPPPQPKKKTIILPTEHDTKPGGVIQLPDRQIGSATPVIDGRSGQRIK